MFQMTAEWWEIIVRVVAVYIFLMVLVRISGKRQLGQLAPMDLLTILLVSETVSPALTADDDTLTAAAFAAGTLFALTFLFAWLTYRMRWFERVTEGTPKVLITDGRLDTNVMASERITTQELGTALRAHGLTSIGDVTLAMVETSGEISFIEGEKKQP